MLIALTNPIIIASVIGAVIGLAGWDVPFIVGEPLRLVGTGDGHDRGRRGERDDDVVELRLEPTARLAAGDVRVDDRPGKSWVLAVGES